MISHPVRPGCHRRMPEVIGHSDRGDRVEYWHSGQSRRPTVDAIRLRNFILAWVATGRDFIRKLVPEEAGSGEEPAEGQGCVGWAAQQLGHHRRPQRQDGRAVDADREGWVVRNSIANLGNSALLANKQ